MKTGIIVCLLFFVLFVYAGNASAAGVISDSNSFFGTFAGGSNTGFDNTFIGFSAGNNNTSGFSNVFLGVDAGHINTSGSRNVFIGNSAGYYEEGDDHLYIDNSDTNDPLIYGDFQLNYVIIHGTLYTTGSTFVYSDARLKKDINSIDSSLEKIMSLRGVSFKWNGQKSNNVHLSHRSHYGVIAQEVQKTLPDIVMKDRNGDMNVAYMELIPVLIEAVKEQQQIISDMAEKIQDIEKDLKLKDNLAMAETHVR